VMIFEPRSALGKWCPIGRGTPDPDRNIAGVGR
jgi:hypothetical protein